MKRSSIVATCLVLASCAKGGDEVLVEGQNIPPEHVFAEAGTDPPRPREECAEETQQIYVVATDKSLYRFYPLQLTFVRVGTLACPTAAGTFSMAIDRYGTAWVEYQDGRLYEVDTFDASCKPTAFPPGQTGFENFGMGYARNGPDEESGETLYVSGAGLAALDTRTFELKFKGSLTFGRTELTSIGTDLYAYSIESGVIARLNKETAAPETVFRTSAIDPWGGFAFAHWGGEFWVFTGQTTSRVTNYAPETDVSTVVVENTGMLIVGAGSSTCAPTTRPN